MTAAPAPGAAPPCGHPYAAPPVPGCSLCLIRDHPFHLARWGGGTFVPPPVPSAPPPGPGTELKALLTSLGAPGAAGCGCENRARQMDEWGVGGCRLRRGEIVDWLAGGWPHLRRGEQARVVLRMLFSGRLASVDPVGALVDEAISRAAGRPVTAGAVPPSDGPAAGD